MPLRNWLYIIALGGLALAASAFAQPVDGNISGQPKVEQSAPEPRPEPPDLSTIESLVERITRAVEAKPEKPDTSEQDARAKRDVDAQEAMALWAKWMTIATGASVGLGLLSLFLIWRTVVHTKRAAIAAGNAATAATNTIRVTREAAEDQLRPYVYATRAIFQWGAGETARVIVEVVNAGQTPATYFEIGGVTLVTVKGAGTSLTVPDTFDYKIWSVAGKVPKTVPISDDGINEKAREVLEARGKKNFVILGRVKYGDIFDAVYETEFAFFADRLLLPKETNMISAAGKFSSFNQTRSSKHHQK